MDGSTDQGESGLVIRDGRDHDCEARDRHRPEEDPVLLELSPIGFYHGPARHPAALPRQASLPGGNPGSIVLRGGLNLEQALHDLEGISHVWVLFWFHRAENWRPKVKPPRSERRRGLFATRSPHRPNPIGLSLVELRSIAGRTIEIGGNDLVDGTPVLDLKPYLPYCDSVPDATTGWIPPLETAFEIVWGDLAREQVRWLRDHGVDLEQLAHATLASDPWPRAGNRVSSTAPEDSAPERTRIAAPHVYACRNWRIHFDRDDVQRRCTVLMISSGYSTASLEGIEELDDRWRDIELHRRFWRRWSSIKKDETRGDSNAPRISS